jgi:hypothetical protein
LEIRFDLLNHFVSIATNAGEEARLVLSDGLSVAAFDREIHSMLEGIGVDVTIVESPYGVPMKTRFTEDVEHASYDRDAVARFWRILDWSASVFDEFSGWLCGKTSPVQLYWHSLDLAFSRFNGARAPARPNADQVTQEAYSHEVIAFGFWAGDESLPEPSYYSYTAPEPAGLRSKALPPLAHWSERNGGSLALLPYEAVRNAPVPKKTLLGFLQGAYAAGATAAVGTRQGWSPLGAPILESFPFWGRPTGRFDDHLHPPRSGPRRHAPGQRLCRLPCRRRPMAPPPPVHDLWLRGVL